MTSGDTGMRHRLERPGAIADYPIEFFIRPGRQGRSYLARAEGRLVQSPISYFMRRSARDMSPGYERDRVPGFGRRITEECAFSHASDRLAEPRPIGCERCRGSLYAHLARPSPSNVVNPRPAAVVPHFKRALEGWSDEPAGLFNPGSALGGDGDVVRAAIYLRKAPERDPLLAEARELLQGITDREAAAALYREKKFAEAAAALERHLARQPDDHNARLLLGLSLQQAGSRARAAEVLREAARRQPRDPSAHYYLARVEYLRGLLAAAEQHARRALALGEPPARVHNLLGLIRVEQGDHDEALAAYGEAVRADPGFFDGYLNAGVELLRLGRAKEALERLEAALRHDPAFPDARYHRGRALIELGRIDEARSDLEAAAPESELARRLLDQLRAGGLAPRAPGSAREVAPIRFRNIAEATGLRFTLENHATTRKHLVETMAGGVAAFDYNNDGRLTFTSRTAPHCRRSRRCRPATRTACFATMGT